VSVAAAVVVLFAVWPLSGADLVMHLTVGRWIWEHSAVPLVDDFSYVAAGEPFIAHSWLSGLAFYLVERGVGTVGFMLLRFVLISVALTFTLRVARIVRAPWPALMLLAPFVLGLMWGRLDFRPQLFTSALLAAELWLIMSVHTGRRSWRWLWALPPLYVLWINLHGGWVQGVAMLAAITGALAVMEVRRRSLGRETTSHLSCRHLAMVLGVCVLALLMNPYGARLVSFPFDMQAPWIWALGPEWQAPWARTGWRLVGGGVFVSMQPAFVGYTALLGGVLLVTVRRWRTADLVPVAVMGLWLALSLWHLRAVGDTVLITGPLVAASLHSEWWRTRMWPVWVGIGLLIGLTAMAIRVEWQVRDWRWTRGEPRCVESAVERLGHPVRVFGDMSNEWLLYRLPHRVKVHYTWEYVAGPMRTAELEAVWKGKASLGAYLERYHVDVILLKNGDFRNAPLLTSMGWVIIHLDDRLFVMVRQTPARQALIYRFIRPWENAPVTADNAPHVLAEANRALQNCPDGATFAWAYKAEALWQLGRHQEAFEAGLKIPERLVIK
jgi:hypothetical protein